MKIGIINDREVLMQTNELHFCDKIVVIDRDTIDRYRLRELLEAYVDDDLYAQSINSFGLQLFECHSLFELIFNNGGTVTFIEKYGADKLEDEEYFKIIYAIAENEKEYIVKQNLAQKKKRQEQVNRKGRPTISPQKISRIKKLYHEDFKTMREIAEICSVSLGTVFKYTSSD